MKLAGKALLAALRKAAGAVEPHKAYDVLQCVRLEGRDGHCILTSFNLSHEVVLSVEAEGDAPPFLVNAEVLAAWLAKATSRSDDVSVDLIEAASIWTAGRAVATLPRHGIDGWSSFGDFMAQTSCVCSGSALAEITSAVLAAVQEDQARLYLSGVRLEAGSVASANEPDRIVAIGTNGVMLVARDMPATGIAGLGGIILAIPTVKAIGKLFSGIETASLEWNDKRVRITAGDMRFQASLIEAVYPERWRQSAGGARVPHVSYDSKELSAAVASITTLASEEGERRFRGVSLSIGESETILRCSDSMKGVSGEDRCAHSLIEPPPRETVTLAANQLMKLIGALSGETIQISVGVDNANPVVLSVAAKTDRIGFSVPLRAAA